MIRMMKMINVMMMMKWMMMKMKWMMMMMMMMLMVMMILIVCMFKDNNGGGALYKYDEWNGDNGDDD